MSGHVFHPGHEELHGVTVVVAGASGKTYLGRYHERGARGVVLRDVAVFDPTADQDGLDAWLARQRKFGVQAVHRALVLPEDEAGEIIADDFASQARDHAHVQAVAGPVLNHRLILNYRAEAEGVKEHAEEKHPAPIAG